MPAVLVSAADDTEVTFVGHEQAAKGGSLAMAPSYSVMILHRDKAGMAEVHEKETDTFYVLDGGATIVTGGRMVDGSVTAPGQQRGASIEGGTSRQLSKGDVIVIPAGVPHWFREVQTSIDYYVVKIIAP
jgi:mannose-6-phosphate isomerase-like protein (cupin superfamily)